MDGRDEQSEAGTVTTDRISVEQLFREHARFVAAFLHRLGVPEADVDDAVQEVFTVAHRKGGFVPGAATPRTWLGAIAVRVASTASRAHSRRREQFDESGVAAPPHDARSGEAGVEAQQSLERVQRALDALDVAHRAVFVLYEIEGEDCHCIAESLGVAVGTVYSRLHTARQRFLRTHERLLREEASDAPHDGRKAFGLGTEVLR